MDAALGAASSGPAAGTLARAINRDCGAGHASNRGIAPIVKRVVWDVVVLDVAPDLLFVPVGEGVQLPETEPLIPAELRRARPGARVDPANPRNPAADLA